MLCYAPTEIGCIVVDISAGFSFEETIAVFFQTGRRNPQRKLQPWPCIKARNVMRAQYK